MVLKRDSLMSDVSKVFGPSGKPPDPSVELKATVNPEEFKKMMQQVQKTDPDEEKKRKQEEEETEEAPPQPMPAEAEYTEPVEGPSFLDVQKGSAPLQQTPTSLGVEGKGYSPSAASSMDSNQGDSVDEIEPSLPETMPTSQFSFSYSQSAPESVTSSTPSQIPPVDQSASAEKKKEKKEGGADRLEQPLPLVAPTSVFGAAPAVEAPKPAPSLAELIAMIPPDATQQELPPEAEDPEKMAAQAPLHAILQTPHLVEVEKKPQPKNEEEFSLFDPSLSEIHAPVIAPPSELGANDPYSQLPTSIQELFTRMLGVITVMNLTPGVTETTFILNSPQFASSVFFGSQIIIKEFSTAPQVFNIQLNGSQQATTAFQSNLTTLAAAFQEGSLNFKVNRLETGYRQDDESPLFHRKDRGSQQEGNRQGQS